MARLAKEAAIRATYPPPKPDTVDLQAEAFAGMLGYTITGEGHQP